MTRTKATLTALAGLTLLAATVGTASAAPKNGKFANPRAAIYTPFINQRIANQGNRIRRGIRRGGLNRFETARVKAGLRRIVWTKRRMAYDGVITRGERRQLMAMLDRNGRKIRRLANNGFKRYGAFGNGRGFTVNLRSF